QVGTNPGIHSKIVEKPGMRQGASQERSGLPVAFGGHHAGFPGDRAKTHPVDTRGELYEPRALLLAARAGERAQPDPLRRDLDIDVLSRGSVRELVVPGGDQTYTQVLIIC